MKIIRGICLVIFLTACQSSIIAELVTQPGQILFHDNFSDPASGWSQTNGTIGSLGYENSAYQMLVLTPGFDLRAISGNSFKDVQIEVDTTRLAGPASNRFGIICRYQDMENSYFFIISSDGYYAIGKINNGVATLLGQNMMAYSAAILQDSGPNHLRFDCIGKSLTGYINGQPVAITQDTDFSSGDTGLTAGAFDEGGVEVSFDNFMVIKP